MKILITNDDGIMAEGLNILSEVISKHHQVVVIAPDREKSACSNAFTINRGLPVKRESEKRFAVSGYPSDCVSIGLHSDICFDPDLILSGINHGPNMGDDLFFSGTVGGARTGFIFGKSSIAVSMDSYHKPSRHFTEASEFILAFIDDFSETLLSSNFFFNINYPDLPKEKISGMKYTSAGRRTYKDKYDIEMLDKNSFSMELKGEIGSVPIEGSDITEVEKGYISITPLGINSTDFQILEKLKNNRLFTHDEESDQSDIA
jgi:5'-nucleotidase